MIFNTFKFDKFSWQNKRNEFTQSEYSGQPEYPLSQISISYTYHG